MAWMKCPNPKCRYSWESRVLDPRACPRCKWRLDYVRPAHRPEAPPSPTLTVPCAEKE